MYSEGEKNAAPILKKWLNKPSTSDSEKKVFFF